MYVCVKQIQSSKLVLSIFGMTVVCFTKKGVSIKHVEFTYIICIINFEFTSNVGN